jgi:hypothetical protein
MGRHLLLKIGFLVVFVAGFYVYDHFIAKPRIRTNAPDSVLPAGWTKWTDAEARFSIGVPPQFVILDPSRQDFKDAVAKLKKTDPISAEHVLKEADTTPPPEGFQAVDPFQASGDLPSISHYRMWVDHARRLIRDDDGALKEMGMNLSENHPGLEFGTPEKIKTPATDAIVWSASGKDPSGVYERVTEIVFLDKYDAFYVELLDLPGGPSKSTFADPIAQSFREYKQDTGWSGGKAE